MDTRKMVKERGQDGFTLVELLVVIAIIALLLAILMPALNKVRKQAESIMCKTQLKEISRCLGIYAYDNQGRMVSNAIYNCRWYDLLGDIYLRNKNSANVTGSVAGSRYSVKQFKCPVEYKKYVAQLKRTPVGTTPSNEATTMYGSNLFFMCQYTHPATDPMDMTGAYVSQNQAYLWFSKLDRIKQPATLPIFWDTNSDSDLGTQTGYPHTSSYTYGWDSSGSKRAPKSVQAGPSINHLKGFNYLFADMHVDNPGNWPYNIQSTGPASGQAMSWAKPGTNWDYLTYFHPLRRLYINGPMGSGNPTTPGDSFPGGLPIR